MDQKHGAFSHPHWFITCSRGLWPLLQRTEWRLGEWLEPPIKVGGGRSCRAEGLFFLLWCCSEHCWWEGRGGENHRAFLSTLLSNPTHRLWCQGNRWLWPWDARWTAALLLQWQKTRNSKRPLSSPAVLWQKTTQSSPVLFNFAGVLHKPQESKGREFHPDPSCYCCVLPGFLWGVHGKLTAGPPLQAGKRLSVKTAAS